ncbi:MAG: Dihydroorotate dehydrogenase [Chlamydiales bacterium]|nr:Dihydroorotate dehydrogenase [Chlamydiales bacterium]MCH9636190.1 Dihydroorotate dehydrogenase [Chlamydiales bacterium]MCH9704104.1 dihydroorotate dehydrogenase [Chlamydiota bacterium]
MKPIYHIDKSYFENAEKGPFFQGEIPQRELLPESEWIDFLGFKVASPLGVPAGPLLNSNWVLFAAKMGFDVVTYKTIRSKAHPAHPQPNMVYVDTRGELTEERTSEKLYKRDEAPKTLKELAATNSFGIPSKDPDFLVEDIARAQNGLAPGQLMIVSVLGTPREGEDYVEDFADAARLAIRGGAQVIEADLSCPNLSGGQGSLFSNPDSVYEITKRIRDAIDVPLIIKVGALFDLELVRAIMEKAKSAGADAICGINTVSMEVLNQDGSAALGENRRRAGVCGGPIRQAALQFVRLANEVGNMPIMATGGVTDPSHFDDFLEAGASIAMSAVGMMWDPYLAHNYHRSKYDSGICI